MSEWRISARDLIARQLSNCHPPSIGAVRRAERILEALEVHGYTVTDLVAEGSETDESGAAQTSGEGR